MDIGHECEICTEKFINENSLILHRRSHSGMKNNCILCNEEFATTPLLLKHLKSHILRERRGSGIFQCGICLRNFEKEEQLNGHFENHINGVVNAEEVGIKLTERNIYKCPICSKAHLRSDLCQQHILKHIMDLSCGICNQVFSKYEDLVNHTRKHTKEELLECGLCDRTFYKKEHFQRHARMHSGETPYQCEICSKLFSRKENLKKHIRSHAISIVVCTICAKEFKLLGYLKIHMSRSHTNNLNHKCDQCDKSYFTFGNLLFHKKTHKNIVTLALKIEKV